MIHYSLEKCKKCGDILYDSESHKCQLYFIRYYFEKPGDESSDSESISLHAQDSHDAAKRFAEWFDRDDHTLLEDGEHWIEITAPNGETFKGYVYAEHEIRYTVGEGLA